MDKWFSHFDAQIGSETYDQVQLLRPDYRKAMDVLNKKAATLIPNLPRRAAILDVACGTAMATIAAFSGRDVKGYRFVGLDLDQQLLDLAKKKLAKLGAKMEPICGDMMQAEPGLKFDLILCVFAYHHVPDANKSELCRRLRRWSNPGAHLLVLEICLHDHQIVPYYEAVKSHLDRATRDAKLCQRFLDWTKQTASASDNSEWKVPQSRVLDDFTAAKWRLQKKPERVWSSSELPADSGCFYFQFTKNTP
ncbi:MAG TPA: class I SAM-dependent methyltransferase [Opitutaceae bacterium]|nr:class I SAM-dependent methyltransferase [Opitutaceae bacterium]